jgi:DNA polymerase III alpha subunit
MSVNTWDALVAKAATQCLERKLDAEYVARLKFEIEEINKQGANSYWLRLYNSGKKYDNNKSGLVLPYLLDITPVDPIKAKIEHEVKFDPEFPDIDVDLLPMSRDYIKKYAEEKYGEEHVCNVGLWLTYKAKLAMQDAATVLGHNRHEVMSALKELPEEFDSMDFEQAFEEFEEIRMLVDAKPEVVELAYKMLGKIKSQGKHAGGLIISDVPIRDFIPLTLCGADKNKQWTSAWTEGMAASQLSKFGFVKFDLLGLLNISYIYNCKKLVKKNRGIDINFDDIDPQDDRAGWMTVGGNREKILLNDPEALDKANKVKMESIFQFDTDFAKSIVEKGGVKTFNDLLIYTSLGRPGPLPMIDVYIKNRDDADEGWKKSLHPKMLDILEETKGVLTFQEQLLRIWVEVCGLTMPEAEAAQKAVKKKRTEILNEISPQVINGAAPVLGRKTAEELWEQMKSFGRYCFNKSHAVAYMIIAYRCLWLKTHFPAEWWAAVLSECPNQRTVQYMGAARAEGIPFGAINANSLTTNFSVNDDEVTPGVMGIKGIGKAAAQHLVDVSAEGAFKDLDDFVSRVGKNKTATERLVKLGGFDSFHNNRKALWMWYIYNYDTTTEAGKVRRKINACYMWSEEALNGEHQRQIKEYQRMYPKRKKIPQKILNWVPTTPRPGEPDPYDPARELTDKETKQIKKMKLGFDDVIRLFPRNYALKELLQFEKEYLGYYWNSPVDMFIHGTNTTIEHAKQTGTLECVIEEQYTRQGARGEYMILNVTDGINSARVNVWGNEVLSNDEEVFNIGTGIRMRVNWQEKWRSFAVKRSSIIMPLPLKDEE